MYVWNISCNNIIKVHHRSIQQYIDWPSSKSYDVYMYTGNKRMLNILVRTLKLHAGYVHCTHAAQLTGLDTDTVSIPNIVIHVVCIIYTSCQTNNTEWLRFELLNTFHKFKVLQRVAKGPYSCTLSLRIPWMENEGLWCLTACMPERYAPGPGVCWPSRKTGKL